MSEQTPPLLHVPLWGGCCPGCGDFIASECENEWWIRGCPEPLGTEEITFSMECPSCALQIGVVVDASRLDVDRPVFGPILLSFKS